MTVGGVGSGSVVTVRSSSNFETLVMNGTEYGRCGARAVSIRSRSAADILRVNGECQRRYDGDKQRVELAGTGTLNGDVVSSGITAPGNSVGMLTINGNFTQTGGSFDVEFDETGKPKCSVGDRRRGARRNDAERLGAQRCDIGL